MVITDGRPKLHTIRGIVSQRQFGMLEAYISKHGANPVFGPVAEKDVLTPWRNVHTFAFIAKQPTPEQRKHLKSCTVDIFFDCDQIEDTE